MDNEFLYDSCVEVTELYFLKEAEKDLNSIVSQLLPPRFARGEGEINHAILIGVSLCLNAIQTTKTFISLRRSSGFINLFLGLNYPNNNFV